MQFCVVGAGAIGALTGAYLVRQGERVHFVDASPENVAAINAGGIRIEGGPDPFVVPAQATLPSDLPAALDVIVAFMNREPRPARGELTGLGRVTDVSFVTDR